MRCEELLGISLGDFRYCIIIAFTSILTAGYLILWLYVKINKMLDKVFSKRSVEEG